MEEEKIMYNIAWQSMLTWLTCHGKDVMMHNATYSTLEYFPFFMTDANMSPTHRTWKDSGTFPVFSLVTLTQQPHWHTHCVGPHWPLLLSMPHSFWHIVRVLQYVGTLPTTATHIIEERNHSHCSCCAFDNETISTSPFLHNGKSRDLSIWPDRVSYTWPMRFQTAVPVAGSRGSKLCISPSSRWPAGWQYIHFG